MILISEQDYWDAQVEALDGGFGDFLKKVDNETLLSTDYDEPKLYLTELIKFALIGYQEYIHLYDYASNIILDLSKLKFFNEPHSKEEVRSYVIKNN